MAFDTPGMLNKLVSLGYLDRTSGHLDAAAIRAIGRFQRHAARPYRMPPPDEGSGLFSGGASGALDPATVSEIDKWIARGWRVPLKRFPLVALAQGGSLRSDAAQEWERVVGIVSAAGGTLEGPYGDTARPVRPNSKVGASHFSFHYSGRAVDINQSLGNRNRAQRYFVVQEQLNHTYWRIYCKTANQDGSQGRLLTRGAVQCYDFSHWNTYDIPEGYYIDLTSQIESTLCYERIKAQSSWHGSYNQTEWWHFQFKLAKQQTFLDEMELIGYSEAQLRAAGWSTDADLDHQPG